MPGDDKGSAPDRLEAADGHHFARQPHGRAKGLAGEQAAVHWLTSQGYEVIDRNVYTKVGEIDLIARHEGVLCFVEVKARSHGRYGSAAAAVTPAKQRRLARAAAAYLALHPWPGACRFDVLGLDLERGGQWRPTLIQDAFRVS